MTDCEGPMRKYIDGHRCYVCPISDEQIKEAVLAERERCIEANPMGVSCPECKVRANEECQILGVRAFHNERWRSAILGRFLP